MEVSLIIFNIYYTPLSKNLKIYGINLLIKKS